MLKKFRFKRINFLASIRMDYKYEPEQLEEEELDIILEEKEESIDDYETSINFLDKIERTSEPITINPEGQQFPDVLKKPLFLKVVPETNHIPTSLTHQQKECSKDTKSIMGFIKFIIMSYIGIIEDIFTMDDISVDTIKQLFTKNDRMIAVTIFVVAVAIVYIWMSPQK